MPDRESCLCLCSAIPPSLPKDNSTFSWSVQQKGNSISGFKCMGKCASTFHVYYNTVIFSPCKEGASLLQWQEWQVWMGWEWQVLVKLSQACVWSTDQHTQTPYTLNELWSLSAKRNSPHLSHITLRKGERRAWAASHPLFCKEQSLWQAVEHMNKQEGLEWEFVVFYHNPMLKKSSWTGCGERAVNKLVLVMGI